MYRYALRIPPHSVCSTSKHFNTYCVLVTRWFSVMMMCVCVQRFGECLYRLSPEYIRTSTDRLTSIVEEAFRSFRTTHSDNRPQMLRCVRTNRCETINDCYCLRASRFQWNARTSHRLRRLARIQFDWEIRFEHSPYLFGKLCCY